MAMPTDTPDAAVFPVSRPFLLTVAGFGGAVSAVGLALMLDGASGVRVGIVAIGVMIAFVPLWLVWLGAAIAIDGAGGRLVFLPGGEAYGDAEIAKIGFNPVTKAVSIDIDKPTWGRTAKLGWFYPMLAKSTLAGFKINARTLADTDGFVTAMRVFAATIERRKYSVDDDADAERT